MYLHQVILPSITWAYWKIRKTNYKIVYILYKNMLAMFSSPVHAVK